MADQTALRTRLKIHLPGMTNDELDGWLLEAAIQHNYNTLTEVPDAKGTMVMQYARYIALQAKATETAENADLNISGKMSINKTSASGNYSTLISRAWADYRRAGGRLGAVVVSRTAARADRR